MERIYFDVSWNQSGSEFLDDILKLTPNRSGTWGMVTAVRDPAEADYHVVFNQPTQETTCDRLLFCMEPPCTGACTGWGEISAVNSYPLSTFHKPQSWHVFKSYDELTEMEPIPKSSALSWVTSDAGRNVNSIKKAIRLWMADSGYEQRDRTGIGFFDSPTDGHILRMRFLDRLVEKYPSLLDLYGRGDFTGPHYHGEIADKWDGLAAHRYTLAIENYRGENYFSEKICDALLAWCMPIYWGCTNLPDFLPEESYVSIDIQDPDAPDRVREIIESDYRERNLGAIAEARRRILDRYQIFPTVEREIRQLSDSDGPSP